MHIVSYKIHPEAQVEYEDYLRFYDASAFTVTTLADFQAEIEGAFEKITLTPLTYRLVKKNGRQRRFGPTKRFHFIIYYVINQEGSPYILAVTHPSRRPFYWIHRT